MLTLMQRFALLQKEKPDISQADLARATGAKPPSVNAWFTGETKSMKAETAAIAASLYGVNALWLATGKGPKHTVELSGTGTIGQFSAKAILEAYTRPSLMDALAEISKAMLLADDLARIQAKPLLAHLIENPEQAEKIIPRLVALLDGEPLTTETKDFVHAKQPS